MDYATDSQIYVPEQAWSVILHEYGNEESSAIQHLTLSELGKEFIRIYNPIQIAKFLIQVVGTVGRQLSLAGRDFLFQYFPAIVQPPPDEEDDKRYDEVTQRDYHNTQLPQENTSSTSSSLKNETSLIQKPATKYYTFSN